MERKTAMKFGITDDAIRSEAHYLRMKACGFAYCDFNMADTNKSPYDLNDADFEEYLKNQKRLADQAGITIWQVHGPWRHPVHDGTPEERAERMEKMKRSIHGAVILGAKYWVVHPIMPYGLQEANTEDAPKTKALNLEFMRELLVTAKQEGVTICLENMPFPDFSLSTPTAIMEIVREINDPSFAMCLDTGHTNVCKEWPSPAQVIREYGQYVKVLHVHDNHKRRDEHLPPFFGSIKWKDFYKALCEIDFNGVLSLECAPSKRLPADIIEDLYPIYFRIAKAICEE
jgi:sugar phosphate isomerase/epimerase